jgi:hypothetical protein
MSSPHAQCAMKSILDPTFRYTPSVQTDIRKTFARVRREQRAQQARPGGDAVGRTNVLALARREPLPASAR